jgi:hypothetical protein
MVAVRGTGDYGPGPSGEHGMRNCGVGSDGRYDDRNPYFILAHTFIFHTVPWTTVALGIMMRHYSLSSKLKHHITFHNHVF